MFSQLTTDAANAHIEQALSGNERALETLLFDCSDAIEQHVRHQVSQRLPVPIGIDDIVQDTFLEAFRSIHALRQQDAKGFTGWLVRIADNRLIDALRAERTLRRGGEFGRLENSKIWEMLSNHETSPSGRFAREESERQLMTALVSLSADRREALRWHYLEGKTIHETSVLMQRTVGSVRRLLECGRHDLARELGNTSP